MSGSSAPPHGDLSALTGASDPAHLPSPGPAAAGRRAAVVMVGVVLMLLVAATLEGFARQLIESTAPRLAIGGAMLVLWLAYFYAPRRKRGPEA